ncbi:MAG: hypothetical protein SRB2_01767 [Desulfobacteraceae bacterium Eth-SRB2]|nr:MAG: hypothetical protein SRB2_01767 [Desulfobacteraceae bacterium Eth-SRB2]
MKNILDKISPNEALEILRLLAKTDKHIQKKILDIAEKMIKGIDFECICDDVFWALDPVMATAFSADDRTMAVSTDSSEVALFDVAPLRFRSLLTREEGKRLSWKDAKTRPGVTGLFRSPPVAFSPNGELLVTAGAAGEVVGWEVDSSSVRF